MARVLYNYNYLYKLPSGKIIQITEKQWGLLALTGDDLANYKSEMAEINASEQAQIDAGDLIITDIDETETTGDGPGTYTACAGTKWTYPNLNEDPTMHENYYNWISQIVADENVVYRPDPAGLVLTP